MTPARHLRGIVPAFLIVGIAAVAAAGTGHDHGSAAPSTAAPSNSNAPEPDPPPGSKDWHQGKSITITGEVMDPACFLEAGSKSIGKGHFQCAVDCARSGQTLAIYDRDHDLIYFIAGELPGKNPNEPLMPYIHKKVDVTGPVYHRAGAYGIVINRVVPHVDKAGAGQSVSGAAAGK
jgi:hypothetical protein